MAVSVSGRFLAPPRSAWGQGASALAGAELALAGADPAAGRVLFVADEAVLGLGLAGAAIDSVEAAGFSVDVRPGVGAEPTPQTIRALLPEAGAGDVAGVVALGGGSALDAAKLAGLDSRFPLALSAGLKADVEAPPGPPLVAIPTTAGTGAEATAVAMLWEGGHKRMFVNHRLIPDSVLLDPALLLELPPAITAAGGLDAISHAVESLLSTLRTPLSEAPARSALALLPTALRAAYDGGGIRDREATLVGSYQAGLGLNASVVLGHSLAYVIAAEAGLSHGVSCAMALPYCLAHARPTSEARIAEIAAIVCADPDADAVDLVRWLLETNAAMGIPPSLEAVGVSADAVPEMARDCVESYPRPNHPRPIEVADIEVLFGEFLSGDAEASWSRAGVAA
jgi:alcohol dehydrogenase class IV